MRSYAQPRKILCQEINEVSMIYISANNYHCFRMPLIFIDNDIMSPPHTLHLSKESCFLSCHHPTHSIPPKSHALCRCHINTTQTQLLKAKNQFTGFHRNLFNRELKSLTNPCVAIIFYKNLRQKAHINLRTTTAISLYSLLNKWHCYC